MWADLCPCEQEIAQDLMDARGLPEEAAEEMALYGVDRRCNACPKLLDKPAGWLTPDP